jgi:hypothetical protein
VHAVKGDGHYLLMGFSHVDEMGVAFTNFVDHQQIARLAAPVGGVVTQGFADVAFQQQDQRPVCWRLYLGDGAGQASAELTNVVQARGDAIVEQLQAGTAAAAYSRLRGATG